MIIGENKNFEGGPLERAAMVQALLQEVEHRANNTLQLAISTLRLQSRRIEDRQARQALAAAIRRLTVLAAAHRFLQEKDRTVDLDVRLIQLCAAYRDDSDPRVDIVVDVEPLEVEPQRAMVLGLLASELIANALKYAFPDGRSGRIAVGLHRADGGLALTVEDDGVGPSGQKIGAGTEITDVLIEGLGGACRRWRPECGGYATSVNLPLA